MAGLVPGQGPGNGLGQQQRAEGVDGKARFQAPALDCRQPFFGLQCGSMQHPGGVDHQAQGLPASFGQVLEGLKAGIVGQVQPAGITRPG